MASQPGRTPTTIGASFRVDRELQIDGKLQRVELERDTAERGIVGDTCLSCGAGITRGQCRLRFTQLPGALLGLLPLAVPMPVLFPVLLSALALGKKRTEIGLPLCSRCEAAHRDGGRLRRASEWLCGGMATAALPLIVLTPSNHVAVAATWMSVMTLFLAGLLKIRQKTHGRVIACELIDDEKVVLLGSPRWRRALPPSPAAHEG
jgi:hypothetical protein